MAVTQQEIANHLGISRMSVVRAFNGHPKVSESKRREIVEAARAMGYHEGSNHAARALVARRQGKTVRTGTIGCSLTLPTTDRLTPYYVHLQKGIQDVAHRAGMDIMVLNPYSSAGWEKVDGIIAHSHGLLSESSLPIPLVQLMTEREGVPSVVADEACGVQNAVEHLVELGHRRIAYLVDAHVPHPQIEARLRGYSEGLKAAGIEADKRWQGNLRIDATTFLERGRDSMREWLARDWKELGCTALLVQNDRAAMGAMEVFHQAGVRIPQDLSVIGFDSTDECELCYPHLTSVRLPLEEIGARAAEMLIDLVAKHEAGPRTAVFETHLEVRNSTAPPAR
jgi:DNA-binding LacI/PurR family transcriptional regulator